MIIPRSFPLNSPIEHCSLGTPPLTNRTSGKQIARVTLVIRRGRTSQPKIFVDIGSSPVCPCTPNTVDLWTHAQNYPFPLPGLWWTTPARTVDTGDPQPLPFPPPPRAAFAAFSAPLPIWLMGKTDNIKRRSKEFKVSLTSTFPHCSHPTARSPSTADRDAI